MQQYRRMPPSKVPVTWMVPLLTGELPVGVGQVVEGGGALEVGGRDVVVEVGGRVDVVWSAAWWPSP